MNTIKSSRIIPAIVLTCLLYTLTQPGLVRAEGEEPADTEVAAEIVQPENHPLNSELVEEQAEGLQAVPEGLDVVVVGEAGELLSLASDKAAAVLEAPDPWLTSGGVLYSFTGNDCEPLVNGLQPCADPIQKAVNFAASGYDPDDGTIYLGNGVFNEFVTVDGFGFIGPISLHTIMSQNGSGSTTLNGGFSIFNMLDFKLNGFTINGNVFVEDTEGTLTLSDLDVSGADGHGITVYNHRGNIVVKQVKSHNNNGHGLYINNLNFSSIYGISEGDNENQISNENPVPTIILNQSEFNKNFGNGIDVQSMSDVIIQHIKANENFWNGASFTSLPFFITLVDDIGGESPEIPNIYVNLSEFNQNGQFFLDQSSKDTEFPQEIILSATEEDLYGYGNGIIGIGGNFIIEQVEANGNGISGSSTVSFGNTIIKCSIFNGNGETGLNAFSFGEVNLKGVTASGNGTSDINAYGVSGTSEVSYKCEKAKKTPETPIIPVTGGVSDDTCGVDGAILELANLDRAIFTGLCPLEASLVREEQQALPGGISEIGAFGSSFTASVLQEGKELDILPDGGSITISFNILPELQGKMFSIYYWDPEINSSAGGWIEIPENGKESSFSSADDNKEVLSGSKDSGDGHFNATVNFSGTFVLVVN